MDYFPSFMPLEFQAFLQSCDKEKIFLLAVILYHRQTGRWLFTLTPAALSYISIAGPESRLVFLPQLLQVHLL